MKVHAMVCTDLKVVCGQTGDNRIWSRSMELVDCKVCLKKLARGVAAVIPEGE